MTQRPLLIKAAAIAVALPLLAACNASQPTDSTKTTPTTSASSSNTDGEFSHNDVMFLEMMIPHHEQAVEMSEIALKNTSTDRIRLLASRIKSAQTLEIQNMKSWVKASGMGGMHSMMDDDMPGLLSDSEMAALRKAKDKDFDRLYLQGMIKHHQGAIDMAATATQSANSEIADFANLVTSMQYNEITEMEALLAQMPR